MPYNLQGTLDAIRSSVSATGLYRDVMVGEPKQPPDADTDGFAAAIFMANNRVVAVPLTGVIELHVVTVRVYTRMLDEVADEAASEEGLLHNVVAQTQAKLATDFDQNNTVRHLDLGGIYGETLGASWGYNDIGGVVFHMVDISLPMVVDDSFTPAA